MKNNIPGNSNCDTLFIGQLYTLYPKLPGTNLKLKSILAEKKLPEGTVVSSRYQTEGRGQAGTTWESAHDMNILLSVLLYPKFLRARNQFRLSQAMALGVSDFIKTLLPDNNILIKWPNDILAERKKISGILIENVLKGEIIEQSIVGIGINVNELTSQPDRTSVKAITGMDYELRHLEEILFACLERRYLQLKSSPSTIKEDYLGRLIGYRQLMKFVNLNTDAPFEGEITGINPDGRLKVKNNKVVNLFDLKEIKLIL